MKQCKYGHWFDEQQFSICPYCFVQGLAPAEPEEAPQAAPMAPQAPEPDSEWESVEEPESRPEAEEKASPGFVTAPEPEPPQDADWEPATEPEPKTEVRASDEKPVESRPVKTAEGFAERREPRRKPGIKPAYILAAVVAVMAVIALAILLGGDKYQRSDADMPVASSAIPDGLSLYVNQELGYSFLYPSDMYVVPQDGVECVSYSPDGAMPCILVSFENRAARKPEDVFEGVKEGMSSGFDDIQETETAITPVEQKTLYMKRFTCKKGEALSIVDAYAELFKQCTVIYTTVCFRARDLDTEFYRVASTLRLATDVYADAAPAAAPGDSSAPEPTPVSTGTESFSHSTMHFSMDFPAMLDAGEVSNGFYAQNDDMLMFAIYANSFPDAAAIYDCRDFADRLLSNRALLAEQLKAEQADFGDISTESVQGRDCVVMPLQVTMDGFTGDGTLRVYSGDACGCYLVYYALADGAETYADIGESCIASFAVEAAPGTTQFESYTDSARGFTVLYAEDEVAGGMQDTGYGTAFYTVGDESDIPVLVETIAKSTLAFSSVDEYFDLNYDNIAETNPYLTLNLSEYYDVAGRYPYRKCDITYSMEGTEFKASVVGFLDDEGDLWAITYTVKPGEDALIESLADNLLWSLRID